MGFLPNHDQEGPGIAPDAPRKTGFPRFWETLSRDFWDVFRAGFLALAGCLPFLTGVAFSLYSHVLIFAPIFGLLGGAIITEQVFVINGIGTYLINAIRNYNYPVVQSTVLVIATMFILINLAVDLLYCVIDPRIKYEG